jgi:hypothetical protein
MKSAIIIIGNNAINNAFIELIGLPLLLLLQKKETGAKP